MVYLIKTIDIRLSDRNTVVIANENTTIGYATFDPAIGELSYIFVHPAFRLQGFARMLIEAAEKACGQPLTPSEPISPLGRKLLENIHAHQSVNAQRR